jgi:hypothetical protein
LDDIVITIIAYFEIIRAKEVYRYSENIVKGLGSCKRGHPKAVQRQWSIFLDWE